MNDLNDVIAKSRSRYMLGALKHEIVLTPPQKQEVKLNIDEQLRKFFKENSDIDITVQDVSNRTGLTTKQVMSWFYRTTLKVQLSDRGVLHYSTCGIKFTKPSAEYFYNALSDHGYFEVEDMCRLLNLTHNQLYSYMKNLRASGILKYEKIRIRNFEYWKVHDGTVQNRINKPGTSG